MSRLERVERKSSNPTSKFMSWKSTEKAFVYYDKSLSENVTVKLPLKIAFLEHYHTIKGWNDKSESGIYSNEVFSIGIEPLAVKSFKGGEIASGLYKEIRNKVRDNGGVYHRSVYVMLEDGSLANLSFKGSVVSAYSDFCKENDNKFEQKWIEINSFEEKKKGATKYTVPIFTAGNEFTLEEDSNIVDIAKILQNYMDTYIAKGIEVTYTVESTEDVSEDLEF